MSERLWRERPCENDHALSPETCALCRLYETDPKYREVMRRGGAAIKKCPFLWKRVRDASGKIVTRKCEECLGAPELHVFHCRHPGAPMGPEVTLSDCTRCPVYLGTAEAVMPEPPKEPRKLLLATGLPPGDITTLTAAVHCLHEQFPGQYLTAVDTPTAWDLWVNNPHVVPADQTFERVECRYDTIQQSNQEPVHFIAGYTQFLADNLRVPLRCTTTRPHLYLSDTEKGWINQVHETVGRPLRYWVINAGTKKDLTCKGWGRDNYQAVVDALRGKAVFAQVGKGDDLHEKLDGVIDLRGKTDLRQLIRLVYHCDGAVGPVSLLMHLAAAWQKPYVCLAGGREPVAWNSYPKQQLLHTLGALPCCRDAPCWKSRVVRLGDGAEQDNSLCDSPTPMNGGFVPRCMTLIRPEVVAATVEKFLHSP